MGAISDLIAAEISKSIVRVIDPESPEGFGSDLVCIDDIEIDARETDPNSNESLAQDLYHRIITARDNIPDAPNFGLNIVRFLSSGATPEQLISFQGQIANEFKKDERVNAVSVVVTLSVDTLRVSAIVQPVTEEATLQFVVTLTTGEALLEILSQ